MDFLDNFDNNPNVEKIEELMSEHNIPNAFFESNQSLYFICGFDTYDVMRDADKLADIIDSNNTDLLAECDIAIFKISNCNSAETLTSIEDYCHNIELLKPIYENKYINNLDSAVTDFGLTGTYVIYEKNIDSDFRGVYFVCGTATDKILNQEIDIREIVNNAKKNDGFLQHQIQAFCLSNEEPFAIHQEIIEYCRNVEFINTLYNEYGLTIPETISVAGLMSMKMLYININNPEISPERRNEYQNALFECFKTEDIYHSKNNPEYNKFKFMTDGHYDINKSNVENWFRRKFGQNNNQVSLEQVFMSSPASVSRITLNVTIADKVQKELNKRPDITYWMSKPQGIKLEFGEKQGFDLITGDVDTRTVELAFSEIHKNDVHDILNRICYPEAFKTSTKEMAQKGPIDVLQIPNTEYENFLSLCVTNNIPFCIDNHIKTQPAGQLNIVYLKADEEKVDAVLTRLSIEAEDFHVKLDPPQSQLTSQTFQNLDDKINSFDSDIFSNKNYTLIGGSLDDLR